MATQFERYFKNVDISLYSKDPRELNDIKRLMRNAFNNGFKKGLAMGKLEKEEKTDLKRSSSNE